MATTQPPVWVPLALQLKMMGVPYMGINGTRCAPFHLMLREMGALPSPANDPRTVKPW